MVDDHIGLALTWQDLHTHVAALAGQVAVQGHPEIVVGIARGGLIPAVLCAHELHTRDLRVVEITHTVSDLPHAAKHDEPRLMNPASLGDLAGRDVLLVDDVVGTGHTLTAAHEVLHAGGARRVRTACVVVNDANWQTVRCTAVDDSVDYLATRSHGWVIFPWETTTSPQ